MARMIVGVGQFTSLLLEKNKNTEKIINLIDQAAHEKVEVLVLPEHCGLGIPVVSDPMIRQQLLEEAEEIPGAFSTLLLNKAKQYGMQIFLSTYERESGDLYNCGIFACPEGRLIKYRKMHLYKTPFFDETYYTKPGSEYMVADSRSRKLGLLICYDSVMPENARILTLKGTEILLIPSAWPKEGQVRWERIIPARAVENQVFVLAAGMCGDIFNGNSMIIDFEGNVLQRLNDKEGLAICEIDLEAQKKWRRETLPYLKHRRPEFYESLSKADYISDLDL